jgi:hypothetical protein
MAAMNRDRYKSRKLSQELTQDLRIVNPDLIANLDEKFDYHEARQRAMNAMKTCFVKQVQINSVSNSNDLISEITVI